MRTKIKRVKKTFTPVNAISVFNLRGYVVRHAPFAITNP